MVKSQTDLGKGLQKLIFHFPGKRARQCSYEPTGIGNLRKGPKEAGLSPQRTGMYFYENISDANTLCSLQMRHQETCQECIHIPSTGLPLGGGQGFELRHLHCFWTHNNKPQHSGQVKHSAELSTDLQVYCPERNTINMPLSRKWEREVKRKESVRSLSTKFTSSDHQ